MSAIRSCPAPRRNLRSGTANLKRSFHRPLGITGPIPWGTAHRVCTAWGYACGYSTVSDPFHAFDLREPLSTVVDEKLLGNWLFTWSPSGICMLVCRHAKPTGGIPPVAHSSCTVAAAGPVMGTRVVCPLLGL